MVLAESEVSGALVTGAGGAVGRAVVERLQAEGYRVAGLDLQGAGGDMSLAVDVADRGQVQAAAERAAAELGPISVLVTAHEHYASAPFGEMPRDDWCRLLDIYLGGTVNAFAAVVPGMVAAGHGTVIACSSWLALAGVSGEAYLAAATGTILAFTKSFSLEVAPNGVRVNCIAIGPLGSEPTRLGLRGYQPGPDELPIRRFVHPSEIADTVSFLLRDGDFYVGQVFCPTGGAVV